MTITVSQLGHELGAKLVFKLVDQALDHKLERYNVVACSNKPSEKDKATLSWEEGGFTRRVVLFIGYDQTHGCAFVRSGRAQLNTLECELDELPLQFFDTKATFSHDLDENCAEIIDELIGQTAVLAQIELATRPQNQPA